MQTYIILSRFSDKTVTDPRELKAVAKVVSDKIKSECPGVRWKPNSNFVIFKQLAHSG